MALLVKISIVDEQAQLIENDPDRYYRPPYFGDGWIGIRLDLGDTDWDAVADWLQRAAGRWRRKSWRRWPNGSIDRMQPELARASNADIPAMLGSGAP